MISRCSGTTRSRREDRSPSKGGDGSSRPSRTAAFATCRWTACWRTAGFLSSAVGSNRRQGRARLALLLLCSRDRVRLVMACRPPPSAREPEQRFASGRGRPGHWLAETAIIRNDAFVRRIFISSRSIRASIRTLRVLRQGPPEFRAHVGRINATSPRESHSGPLGRTEGREGKREGKRGHPLGGCPRNSPPILWILMVLLPGPL